MKSAGHFKTKSLISSFHFYNFYLWGCYPDTAVLIDAHKTPSYLLTCNWPFGTRMLHFYSDTWSALDFSCFLSFVSPQKLANSQCTHTCTHTHACTHTHSGYFALLLGNFCFLMGLYHTVSESVSYEPEMTLCGWWDVKIQQRKNLWCVMLL